MVEDLGQKNTMRRQLMTIAQALELAAFMDTCDETGAFVPQLNQCYPEFSWHWHIADGYMAFTSAETNLYQKQYELTQLEQRSRTLALEIEKLKRRIGVKEAPHDAEQ